MAQDHLNIVELTTEPHKQEDDEAVSKDENKKNFMALQAIQNSRRPDTVLIEIEAIHSANIARNMPNNINTGRENNRHFDQYKSFVKDVQLGFWPDVQSFISKYPNAVNEKITDQGKTALHIAVDARHDSIVKKLGDQMSIESLAIQDNDSRTALHIAAAVGHEDIVEVLVHKMWTESLEIQDKNGWTALAETAFAGNYRMAKCMLTKNMHLASIGDMDGRLPVVLAIEGGYKKLACYLYTLTPREDLKGICGATLCTKAIYTRTLAIALNLLRNDMHLALALNKEKVSPLYALASTPNAFPSENQLVFWKRWIYSRIRIDWEDMFRSKKIEEVERRQGSGMFLPKISLPYVWVVKMRIVILATSFFPL
ncbi:uncharacterized protein LOC132167626 isoform X1 [Corylus avellana]|uniref:uncharacterized protein LOC132167626 isoform X1 n=1 Tax=Corylus avellana TaxID=13451 RepID=UPI00286B17EE|nr:uncharacterized protein LOC132167626 isoform X1 [Corylus avellana]